ncbi:MAG: UDP-N-acetylmuramate:L-alanyl-gamma-D-glutamyl-meso-diaminopimelate ligase [Pseudomonadales bacterium]|nr:UDP-N-acetylmuramate:L-alanyl-gamma-D-glutamyl-meso-diaminopimelate ligase [Pseudomonadales bacterium]
MHIHILGICGTFMGSLAILAKELGHQVSGCDAGVYPPMSTQLEAQGITLMEAYKPEHLQPHPDLVIVGNAMSRGNPCVEYVLNKQLNYTSGPQWLCDHILKDKWVLAVAGTHGKTTTSTMLAWILEYAGMKPGFLIGGVPKNFDASARLGDSAFFVVEADEYDSAFFDKRSKFIHYRPRTAILNNLEFDHADIFDNLAAIQKQFHHLVRTIPSQGLIISPDNAEALDEVLETGCWSETTRFGFNPESPWRAELLHEDGSRFKVITEETVAEIHWSHQGTHNVNNAIAAIAAAHHVGVRPETSAEALCQFSGVKRRMELLINRNGFRVYDDFAHHPTAIASTLSGLRKQVGTEKIIAVIEPRSNTMRMGAHRDKLAESCALADEVIWYQPAGMHWSLEDVVASCRNRASIQQDIDSIISSLMSRKNETTTHILIMSNGGFAGIHRRLVDRIKAENTP